MEKRFLSIEKPSVNEIVILKSRFICSVMPVKNEDEAKAFISSVKARYTDANHNCYAYIADEGGFYVKFSDDGEPQGTAGMPMLEVLKNRKLKGVAAVVTRYFGGTKLGAGGLVRAYSESVCKALDIAGVIEYVESTSIKVKVSFSTYPKILKYFNGIVNKVIATDFLNDSVVVTFCVPSGNVDSIRASIMDLTSGKGVIEILDSSYKVYKK